MESLEEAFKLKSKAKETRKVQKIVDKITVEVGGDYSEVQARVASGGILSSPSGLDEFSRENFVAADWTSRLQLGSAGSMCKGKV